MRCFRSASQGLCPTLAAGSQELDRVAADRFRTSISQFPDSLQEHNPLSANHDAKGTLPSNHGPPDIIRARLSETPSSCYARLRLERARTLLRSGGLAVAEIAATVGFADSPSFSHRLERVFGLPPSRARNDVTGL